MKKALRKGSNTSDDDSQMGGNGDETDTEQHDSLPRDHESTLPTTVSTRRKSSKRRNSIETPNLTGIPERKPSLKNIVKMAAQKDSTNETGPKTTSTTNHLKDGRMATVKRESKERSTARSKAPENNALTNDPSPIDKRMAEKIDEESQEKIVAERRRSILLRQQNIPNDQLPGHGAPPTDAQLNYKVVNEKKQSKEPSAVVVRRNRRSASEEHADVFQYDQNEAAGFISDDDNTSYREDSTRHVQNRISFEESDTPSADGNHIRPPPDRRGSSPDYAEIVKRPLRDSNTMPEESNHEPVQTLLQAKPKRRMNSFLALVNKVVTTKKTETLTKDPEAVNETILEEDFSAAPTAPKTTAKRRDSMSQSLRRKTKSTVKRQDSQTSVWSDNIPVITISKTASDECILEDNVKEAANSNHPSLGASRHAVQEDRFSD